MPRKKKDVYLTKLDMSLVPDWEGNVVNKIWIDINDVEWISWSKVFIDLIFDEWIATWLDLASQTWASDDQKKTLLLNYIIKCQDLIKGLSEKPDQA